MNELITASRTVAYRAYWCSLRYPAGPSLRRRSNEGIAVASKVSTMIVALI